MSISMGEAFPATATEVVVEEAEEQEEETDTEDTADREEEQAADDDEDSDEWDPIMEDALHTGSSGETRGRFAGGSCCF